MKEKFSIGKVSELCNIPIKTLRYYDKVGLLIPEYRNEENKYRYYSKNQLTTIHIIKNLKLQGFNLKIIKKIISTDNLSELKIEMMEKCKELIYERENLEKRLKNCYFLLDRINFGLNIKKSILNNSLPLIKVEEIPSGKFFFTRKIMKGYSSLDVSLDRWVDIYELCNKFDIPTNKNIILTFHEKILNQFLGKDCDVEFSIPIDNNINIPNNISKFIKKVEKYTAVTSYHIGKYSEIIQTYISMCRYINDNKFEISGPISEEYIISPLDIKDESEHITKIIIPIKNFFN